MLVAVLMMITSCTSAPTREAYDNVINTWIGQREGYLVSEWGVPTKSYPLEGNEKVISYEKNYGAETVYYQTLNTAITSENKCTTNFLIKDGMIKSWRADGNSCVARTPSSD